VTRELAVGNYLQLSPPTGTILRAQNYHINESVRFNNQWWTYLPFGFSGITANRRGENSESVLVFANNEISRAWGMDAIENAWLAECWLVILDPDTRAVLSTLTSYAGQVAGGSWEDTTLNLRLDNILDAVGTDVPARILTSNLVGKLPVSANLGF
jgi:hypothetical protein